MIKQILFLIISTPFMAMSQVGVGTNNVDPSAKFQIESTNKGFLPPRIALTAATDVATIASPAAGLMVYNTATAGSGATAITPGIHYFDGAKWVRMEASAATTGGGSDTVTYVSGSGIGNSNPNSSPNNQLRSYTWFPATSEYRANSFRIGFITLPAGKWEVNLQQETWVSNPRFFGGTCRVRLQFWIQDNQTQYQMSLYLTNLGRTGGKTTNAASPAVNGYPPLGGGDALVQGSANFTFPILDKETLCKGTFLINNTSGASKTYHVYMSEMFDGCTPFQGTDQFELPEYYYLGWAGYAANSLYATKIK